LQIGSAAYCQKDEDPNQNRQQDKNWNPEMITNMFFKLPICKEIQAFKIPISSPITMPSLFFRKRTVINMLSLPLVAQCLFSHEAIATCQNALPYVEKGKENELK